MTSHHYLHTGQRTCHADDGHEVPCAGSGQDASFAVGTPWPEPRFELHDNEVIDHLTGLIWSRDASLNYMGTNYMGTNYMGTNYMGTEPHTFHKINWASSLYHASALCHSAYAKSRFPGFSYPAQQDHHH